MPNVFDPETIGFSRRARASLAKVQRPDDRYTSELDGNLVDASLLQMPCVGYKPSDPSRSASTYELISQRIGRNRLIDRYEHGHDGFSSREGAFGIRTFWATHNLACQNRLTEARRFFDASTNIVLNT